MGAEQAWSPEETRMEHTELQLPAGISGSQGAFQLKEPYHRIVETPAS
jgi:hypothetical protein